MQKNFFQENRNAKIVLSIFGSRKCKKVLFVFIKFCFVCEITIKNTIWLQNKIFTKICGPHTQLQKQNINCVIPRSLFAYYCQWKNFFRCLLYAENKIPREKNSKIIPKTEKIFRFGQFKPHFLFYSIINFGFVYFFLLFFGYKIQI